MVVVVLLEIVVGDGCVMVLMYGWVIEIMVEVGDVVWKG